MALVGHFGYRMPGQKEASGEILDKAAQSAESPAWPFPVIRYLRREIPAEELLARARNNDERTEAHAYIGMDLLLSEFLTDAMIHFHWAAKYGNQSFCEYTWPGFK